MSRFYKAWLVIAVGLVVAQAAASLVLSRGFSLIAISDLTQLTLLFSGVFAIAPNLLATHGRTRLFWGLILLGVAFWCSYQVLWSYFEVLLRQDVPNPFAGDVVLFLHLVPMMAALALQPHAAQDNRTVRLGSLDFALLLVWWLYLYLFAVIPWQYVSPQETIYEHSLNALYLTEKIVFLCGLVVLGIRSRGRWRLVYANLFGASLTYALSSYLANWAIERNAYYSGSVYDVPLAASMCWITIVGILAAHSSLQQQPARDTSNHSVWAARLGMITVFSLPLFAAWSVFDVGTPAPIRKFRLVLTLGSLLVMGSLVFLKQHLLDEELVKLLDASERSFKDLQRVQAQLVQSEKMASLGQLVGGAAHELNNPLTAMLGYSDILTGSSLGEEQRVLAEKIETQARRTRILVSGLLSFVKQTPAQKIPIEINGLIQTVLKLCSSPNSEVQIQTNLGGDLPKVMGDSNQLLQVCLHIANTALQSVAEKNGTLRVRTYAEDEFVRIEFCEDEPPVAKQQPDSDAANEDPAAREGTLALGVCYNIIQEHEGRLECQKSPQGGMLVLIELPALLPSASAPVISWKPGRVEPQEQVT